MAKPNPTEKTLLGSVPVAVPLLTPHQLSVLVDGLTEDEMRDLMRTTAAHNNDPAGFLVVATDWFQKRGVVPACVAMLSGGVA